MSKIGTAHIEIKPVINVDALAAIMQQIEDAVAEGVARGLAASSSVVINQLTVNNPAPETTETTMPRVLNAAAREIGGYA